MSSVREVRGGSPQGIKLGNILSVDDIMHGEVSSSSPEISPLSAIPEEYRPAVCSTLIQPSNDNSIHPNPYRMRNKKNVIRDTIIADILPNGEYEEAEVSEVGYINDLNIVEVINVQKDAVRYISTRKEIRKVRSKGCETNFQIVKTIMEEKLAS